MYIVILSFVICMSLVASKCPANTTNFNSMHELQYNFVENTVIQPYKAFQGPISGDVYQIGRSYNTNPNSSFIIRLSDPNTILWSQFYQNYELSIYSVCMDPDETVIYTLQTSPLPYIRISGFHTENGTYASAINIGSTDCNSENCWLIMGSNNILYAALQASISSERSMFVYEIDNGNSYHFPVTSSYDFRAFTWLKDRDVFACFHQGSSANDLIMARANFTDNTYSWYKHLGCAATPCNTDQSSAVYKSDNDIIYLSLLQSSSFKFLILNATVGSITKVFIANNIIKIPDSYLYDSQTVYTSAKSSSDSLNYIFAYHISNDSFTQFKFNDTAITIYAISYSSISSRFIFYGDVDDQYLYTFQTLSDSLLDFEDISEDTSQIVSSGDISNYVLASTSGSLSSTFQSVFTSGIGPLATKAMNVNIDKYTDVVYHFDTPTDSGYFSLIENWNQTLTINITCSINGDISLEHSIESYDNYTAPTWVTVDDVNNQLSLSIPEVSVNTDYSFKIRTNQVNSSVNYYMIVNLTVLNCQVSNCGLCQSTSVYECHKCSSGYEVSGTQCIEIMPESIQNAQIATQSTIGISMGVAAAVSLMNMSSPVGVWSIINQFQMLMLLLLTGAFIPLTVRHYLSGMDFVSLNFDFIPFIKVPLISDLYLWMKFEQHNDDLKDVGLDYGSTVVNNISFLVILVLFIITHLPIALIYTQTRSKTGLCSKIINLTCKILTFTAYIRLVLENFQYMLLCSISEAYRFDTSTKNKRVSLIITYTFAVLCVCFYFFIFYQFNSTKRWLNRKYYAYSQELFAGLKESNTARSYTIIIVTRRLLLCIILVCLQNIDMHFRLILFFIIQISYFICITIMRPFEEKTNNVIEIVNEFMLTVMTSMLLHYNESSRWDAQIEDVFVYTIMANSVSITFILTVSFIIGITIKCCKRRSNKTEVKRYINNETSHNVLRRKNDLSMVDLTFQRNNSSNFEGHSNMASKMSINHNF